jgi:hypothetical protein
VLEHLPYSSDLAPSEFFLFPKIKEILKRRNFDDADNIRSNTKAGLKVILKTSSKIVLKCGLGAGVGALFPKESTLKATAVIYNNEVSST